MVTVDLHRPATICLLAVVEVCPRVAVLHPVLVAVGVGGLLVGGGLVDRGVVDRGVVDRQMDTLDRATMYFSKASSTYRSTNSCRTSKTSQSSRSTKASFWSPKPPWTSQSWSAKASSSTTKTGSSWSTKTSLSSKVTYRTSKSSWTFKATSRTSQSSWSTKSSSRTSQSSWTSKASSPLGLTGQDCGCEDQQHLHGPRLGDWDWALLAGGLGEY